MVAVQQVDAGMPRSHECCLLVGLVQPHVLPQ